MRGLDRNNLGVFMRQYMAIGVAGLSGLLASCATPPEQVARADYQTYCASCHGTDATGGGPLAKELDLNAPDLTRIAARNGGEFPTTRVMSVIDGYTRADQHGSKMPEFGALLEGKTVLVDYGDGVMTPTPAPLVALAAYLEGLQG